MDQRARPRASAPSGADVPWADDLWDVAITATEPQSPPDGRDRDGDGARRWTLDYDEVE
jgi:hypothetical protein